MDILKYFKVVNQHFYENLEMEMFSAPQFYLLIFCLKCRFDFEDF